MSDARQPTITATRLTLACGVCGSAHGGTCEECEGSPPILADGFRCECGGVWLADRHPRHERECVLFSRKNRAATDVER